MRLLPDFQRLAVATSTPHRSAMVSAASMYTLIGRWLCLREVAMRWAASSCLVSRSEIGALWRGRGRLAAGVPHLVVTINYDYQPPPPPPPSRGGGVFDWFALLCLGCSRWLRR